MSSAAIQGPEFPGPNVSEVKVWVDGVASMKITNIYIICVLYRTGPILLWEHGYSAQREP